MEASSWQFPSVTLSHVSPLPPPRSSGSTTRARPRWFSTSVSALPRLYASQESGENDVGESGTRRPKSDDSAITGLMEGYYRHLSGKLDLKEPCYWLSQPQAYMLLQAHQSQQCPPYTQPQHPAKLLIGWMRRKILLEDSHAEGIHVGVNMGPGQLP